MNLELVRLSQDMDLADGEITNLIVLKLPSGFLLKAIVSAEGAQAIIANRMGAPHTPADPTPTAAAVQDTMVFGGDEYQPTPQPPPQPAVVRPRPRTVAKDEYGYPIVSMPGGVDPDSLSSSANADEDGVGQI